jgi:hypothetical protein
MYQRTFELSLVVIIIISLVAFAQFPGRTLAPLGDVPAPGDEQFDPARFGLPARIDNYNVLAVLTPDNTACMLPGTKRVVLQTVQTSIFTIPKTGQAGSIEKELEQYGIDSEGLQVQVVGPTVSARAFLEENHRWNEKARTSGCMRTHSIDTMSN